MCESNEKLIDKVAIVTGGSSGIGYETAKDLAYRGAKVIIASRNITKLKIARNKIEDETGNSGVTYKVLDLGSLKSVRSFTREIQAEGRLHILVNNAGAVALPDILSSDEINLTMQVNFFGTFLLTFLLLPLLKSSAPSRIINGSAASMYMGQIDFDSWNDVGKYSSLRVLANSKLAMALYTAELNKRLKGSGVTANSYDPFIVRDTNIFTNIDGYFGDLTHFFVNIVGRRKEDVGKEIGFLASAKHLKSVSGVHYVFCKKWFNHWSVNDVNLTRKLWDEAKNLLNITIDEDWERNGKDNKV